MIGDKGEISLKPGYTYVEKLAYTITIDGKAKEHEVSPTDHFGGELQYFSDCILQDIQPEPDGEEGWCDVRIIAAIERALQTGEVQKLEPYKRKRQPTPEQVIKLSSVKMPSNKELINARSPTGE